MAIGAAKMLGYDLPVNFNLPYLAHNVTELWKRWHITLSTWLMKYVYISLGGNRKGKARTYCNLVLTMVIGGIWHGANWTYVIWGLLHGIALAIHKAWMTLTGSNQKKHSIPSNIVSIVVTFLFTTFCWIFFRAPSLHAAWIVIRRMFTFQSGVNQPYFWLFVTVGMYFLAMLPPCCVHAAGNGSRRSSTPALSGRNIRFLTSANSGTSSPSLSSAVCLWQWHTREEAPLFTEIIDHPPPVRKAHAFIFTI